MIRITASKNTALLRYRGQVEIDQKANEVRARFATLEKYQIYADKREEAQRFLAEIDAGGEPDASGYPYLVAETGLSAATMIDLASMWVAMDASWKGVSALIEEITMGAKIRVGEALDQQAISEIVAEAQETLDVLGDKPPAPPKARQV